MRVRAAMVVTVLLLSILAIPMAIPATAQGCSYPVDVRDATGTDVTIEEEPTRVVTLSPSAAQIMWEIGAREQVVGVSSHAAYLEGAETRTNVSGAEQMVSVETVVNLSPDLVLAPNVVPVETVETLRATGHTVYHFPEAKTIDDVYESTHITGRLVGECEAADQTVDRMEAKIRTANAAASGRERPDVLYLFFGYTAGKDTFINEIIETAGGNNVAVDANIDGYAKISEEVIIREDPDWIIRNSDNPLGVEQAVLNQTTAGQRDRIVVVDIEHLNQPAPRIVHAITTLAASFHPDAYARANESSTRTSATSDASNPGEAQIELPSGLPEAVGLVVVVVVLLAGIATMRQRYR